MVLLSPSVLSADFGNLNEEILKLEKGGADYIHLDVMDGNYVPNISFGAPVINKLRTRTNIPFDVHLMIDKPERYIDDFVSAGADILSIHPESTIHLHRTIQQIKEHGLKAGVVLNPATPLESIEHVLHDVDLILIMTVNPGFGGQQFIKSMKEKIIEIRRIIDRRSLDIKLEVDGGIKLENAQDIIDWGADIIVVGTGIFDADDVVEMTRRFKSLNKNG